MRLSKKTVLLSGIFAVASSVTAHAAEVTVAVPPPSESCVKLFAALESCDRGSKGPFGVVRKTCKDIANMKYKCAIPIDELRKLLEKN